MGLNNWKPPSFVSEKITDLKEGSMVDRRGKQMTTRVILIEAMERRQKQDIKNESK